MINISKNQKQWVIRLFDGTGSAFTVPADTYKIKYYVDYEGSGENPIEDAAYNGVGYYFGNYDIDLTSFVDYKIAHPEVGEEPNKLGCYIEFYDEDGTTLDFVYKSYTITKPMLALTNAADPSTVVCPTAVLKLTNSDFRSSTGNETIVVPLAVENGILKGNTNNKLDKITYIDRYGDTYNDTASNKYELECFVEPSWLNVTTGKDIDYAYLIGAMQSARSALYVGKCGISGLTSDKTNVTSLNVRVKDVEEINTHSKYTNSNVYKGLKITLEVRY